MIKFLLLAYIATSLVTVSLCYTVDDLELDDSNPEGPLSEDKYMVYSEIVQKVDHFGNDTAINSKTWSQRYQYNSKFYNSSVGYVFLMIGGQGTISGLNGDKWVRREGEAMMVWAAEFQAAVFQLEHRFYGDKLHSPFGDQTVASLQYLTIDQALADIHEFMNQMNEKYFPNDKPIWITFGGSYRGVLSAWYRSTYPEMTAGAVASSSPIDVLVDNYGHAISTEKAYRSDSSSCGDVIRTAITNTIQKAYDGVDSRKLLKQQFNLCDDFDESNLSKSLQFFFQNVYGYFAKISQYSGNNMSNATRSGLGVPAACQILNNSTIGDEIQRVNAVMNLYDAWHRPTKNCRPNNYTSFIQFYSDTSMPNSDVIGTRGRLWQACTELGQYQTTDGGNHGVFGSTVPLDFFADQCIDLFGQGYNLDKTFKLVDGVRMKYGGANGYKGSNIVFPNGSLDPWQDLGRKLSDIQNGIDSFLITGSAHCADIYPPRESDSTDLKNGRIRIRKNFKSWLDNAQELRQKSGQMINYSLAIVFTILIHNL